MALGIDITHRVGLLLLRSEQCGTVVNIRVRHTADGAAPGIKVKFASGAQEYFTFSDVVPYVHSEQEEQAANHETGYVLYYQAQRCNVCDDCLINYF